MKFVEADIKTEISEMETTLLDYDANAGEDVDKDVDVDVDVDIERERKNRLLQEQIQKDMKDRLVAAGSSTQHNLGSIRM